MEGYGIVRMGNEIQQEKGNSMREKKSVTDRLGIYIGNIRTYEGIPQKQLARGLCTEAHLARIEIGEREADKLLTDALLQRLGKPADLFMRLLEEREAQRYRQRKQILRALEKRQVEEAESLLRQYQQEESSQGGTLQKGNSVLNEQFIRIVELNLQALRGVERIELEEKILHILHLTQPEYGNCPLSELLLSRNEGYLVLAHLELRERREGEDAVIDAWRELRTLFGQPRYEKGERVYLAPYVTCHIALWECQRENYGEARRLCEQMIEELQEEQKLYGYKELLELRIKIADLSGREDTEAEKLVQYLQQIVERYGRPDETLLFPYMEGDNVHSLNQVIAERRKFLGLSAEKMADGICNTSTFFRIERVGNSPHKRIRSQLLQRVHLSGERYDYEIITDRYEDYLLRSRLGRAINRDQWEMAEKLYQELREHTPDTETNRQYLEMIESCIREEYPTEDPNRITIEERIDCLRKALFITLPKTVEELLECDVITLSINEIVILKQLASCYEKVGGAELGISILFFVKRCMERVESMEEIDVDAYTLCMRSLASMLGNVGRYEQSNEIAEKCLLLLLSRQDCQRVAGLLYELTWNLEQQEMVSEEGKEKCLRILKQTYAAAIISADILDSSYIPRHCEKVYGFKLSL